MLFTILVLISISVPVLFKVMDAAKAHESFNKRQFKHFAKKKIIVFIVHFCFIFDFFRVLLKLYCKYKGNFIIFELLFPLMVFYKSRSPPLRTSYTYISTILYIYTKDCKKYLSVDFHDSYDVGNMTENVT